MKRGPFSFAQGRFFDSACRAATRFAQDDTFRRSVESAGAKAPLTLCSFIHHAKVLPPGSRSHPFAKNAKGVGTQIFRIGENSVLANMMLVYNPSLPAACLFARFSTFLPFVLGDLYISGRIVRRRRRCQGNHVRLRRQLLC